jgi:hypothetical protein
MIGDDNKNFLIELYKERKRIQSMIQKYKWWWWYILFLDYL